MQMKMKLENLFCWCFPLHHHSVAARVTLSQVAVVGAAVTAVAVVVVAFAIVAVVVVVGFAAFDFDDLPPHPNIGSS